MEQRRLRLRADHQLSSPVTLQLIDAQERRFADAFASGDISSARDLYDPAVVYVSPTTRLFDRPPVVEGVDATLAFIQQTIAGCTNIEYRATDRAVLADGEGAFVRISFDFDLGDNRLRSVYVVLYRYRAARIARQELYYDPSGHFERLGPSSTSA